MAPLDPQVFKVGPIMEWYTWGAFVACFFVLAITFWTFYDSQQKQKEASFWKVVLVAAILLILPSLLFRLNPMLAGGVPSLLDPLALLGLIGVIMAVVGFFAYRAGILVQPMALSAASAPALAPWYPPLPMPAPGAWPVWEEATQFAPVSAAPVIPIGPADATQLAAVPAFAPLVQDAAETVVLRAKPFEAAALAWLIVTSGPRIGKDFRLGKVNTIGRDATTSDIIIDDQALSRQHARVSCEDERFVVFDLASVNGTFLRDRRSGKWKQVEKQMLKDGDVIKVGETILTFMEIEEAEERPSAHEEPRKARRRRAAAEMR